MSGKRLDAKNRWRNVVVWGNLLNGIIRVYKIWIE